MKVHVGIDVAEIFSAQITLRMNWPKIHWKFGIFGT